MQEHPSDPCRDPIDILADEFARDFRSGSCPSVSQYVRSYPEYADEIRELFPSIAMIEKLGCDQRAQRSGARQQHSNPAHSIERLGDFRIIREIGRGGMGVVYEAEQESLGRTVALKVLTANAVSLPQQLKRFHREAQAAAKLHHTNIVPIFGVGEEDGLHYYVMQFIKGARLDQVGLERPSTTSLPGNSNGTTTTRVDLTHRSLSSKPQVDWQRLADLGAQTARAVDYAHGQGVLHRDIKPANLLVDGQGTVWVTDFGLAKMFGDDQLTRTGDLFGTLRYMAPEQFEGESTAASDIYSIGITLYELATQRPAFAECEPRRLMRQISQHNLPRPRTLDRSIPSDLETVILKACAFDQRHRYARAGDLADDLQRFVNGEPILARRASLPKRLWRWSCREPALAVLSGLSFALLLLVAVVSTVGYIRVDDARQQAVEAGRQAVEAAQREKGIADQLKVALQDVEEENLRAKEEYDRAEDNLVLAMRAFEGIIQQVSRRGLPESLEWELDEDAPHSVRSLITADDAELLQDLLAFYVEFAERNDADEAVQLETAKAYQQIGDIRLRLGQFQEALAASDAALEIYERVSEGSETNRPFVLATVDVLNQRGTALAKSGDFRQAFNAHFDAMAQLLDQPTQVADTRECRFALADTYNRLAALRPSDSFALGPGNLGGPRGLGRPGGPGRFGAPGGPGRGPMRHLGMYPASTGRDGRSWMGHFSRASLDILNELVAEDPSNAEYRLALARCYRNHLPIARHEDRAGEAVSHLQKSISILEELNADFPDDPRFAFELADTLSINSPALSETEYGAGADERLRRAVAIARRLTGSSPHQPEYDVLLANALHHLGLLLDTVDEESKETATQSLAEAEAIFENLMERFPSVPIYMISVSQVSSDLGTLQRKNDDLDASCQTLNHAVRRLESLDAREVDVRFSSRPLMALYANFGTTLQAMGKHRLAKKVTDKARSYRIPLDSGPFRRQANQMQKGA